MKKIIVIIIIQVLLTFLINAQPNPTWVNHFNGSLNQWDEPSDMVIDYDGNIVVYGKSTRMITDTKIHFETVIIKYDTIGNEVWTNLFNTGIDTNTEESVAIAIDGANNIYVVGFSEDIAGNTKIFLIKYSPEGNVEWVEFFEDGSGIIKPTGIAYDGNGNLYVAANGGIVNAEEIHLLKFDASGNFTWSQTLEIENSQGGLVRDITLDSNGNIYLTGDYIKSGTFFTDIFLAKYNPGGEVKWTQSYEGPASMFDFGHVVRVDSQDNILVTGLSEGVHEDGDYVVIKYDYEGNELWVSRFDGGYGGEWPVDMVIDSEDNVYVTGWSIQEFNTKSTATIKYNSAGDEQWLSYYHGIGYYFNDPASMALGNDGSLVVAARVADTEFTNDWMIIAYSTDMGEELGHYQHNGTGTDLDIDYPVKVLVDTSGGIYVTGCTEGQGSDWDITTLRLVIIQESNYYVTLFAYPDTIGVNLSGTGHYHENETISISSTSVEGFIFIGWKGNQDDVALLDDSTALSTSFIMPSRDVALTAFYVPEEPKYTANFQVLFFDSSPVEGATILIENVHELITNQEGGASIELLNGDYSYTLDYQGLPQLEGVFSIEDQSVAIDIHIPFPYYVVKFMVSDLGQTPIEGAEITIQGIEIELTTNPEGIVSTTLSSGNYSFQVVSEGYFEFDGEFIANDNQHVDIDVVLTPLVSADHNPLSKLSLYPNPFNRYISIDKAQGATRVIVSNIIGQILIEQKLSSNEKLTLDTQNLPKGVYMVIVDTNNGERVVRKMIKQ